MLIAKSSFSYREKYGTLNIYTLTIFERLVLTVLLIVVFSGITTNAESLPKLTDRDWSINLSTSQRWEKLTKWIAPMFKTEKMFEKNCSKKMFEKNVRKD